VKSARQALGDDGKAQRFIKTAHGRGFRFVAAVEVAPPAAVVAPTAGDRGDREGGAPFTDQGSRPSIAVLPLRLVGDPGPYAAIADGLPDELIAELSRLRWLFVTARGSSFRPRLADLDVGEIGRLLGVRYCLSGTVEITGARLTIAVELIDTRDGGVVWADRFAGAIDDVHTIRAEIRSRVLTELEIRIPLHEAALARLTGTENLDAWAAYHLGLQHMFRFNREDNAAATALFERAVALDPGFARAHAGLSFLHFQTAFLRHTDDLSGEIALARRCAERGLELDHLDPFVNFTMGRCFWLVGDLDSEAQFTGVGHERALHGGHREVGPCCSAPVVVGLTARTPTPPVIMCRYLPQHDPLRGPDVCRGRRCISYALDGDLDEPAMGMDP